MNGTQGILFESSLIKFDVLGCSHLLNFKNANDFVNNLLEIANKLSLVFTEIVASRVATIGPTSLRPAIDYEHTMNTIKSLDAYAFLKILQCPLEIATDDCQIDMDDTQVPIVESAVIKFDVLGVSHVCDFEDASDFVNHLLKTADKASLVFTEIVASRVINIGPTLLRPSIDYEHTMKKIKSLDTDSFLKILQYPLGISNEGWTIYIQGVEREVVHLSVQI